MLQRVFDLFTSWQVKFSRHHNIALWRIVPYCIMWCLWWECNTRSFEGCEQSIFEIKSFFFHALLDWNLALQTCSCFSLPDLLDHSNMRSWLFYSQSTSPIYLGLFVISIKVLLFIKNKKKKIVFITHKLFYTPPKATEIVIWQLKLWFEVIILTRKLWHQVMISVAVGSVCKIV